MGLPLMCYANQSERYCTCENYLLMAQVSFVVIAFNEAIGIQSCIEGILGQETEIDYEIILIDDGSTDSTAEIVKNKFGNTVQIHSQQNLGRGKARAVGIQIAKSPLIAMVDSDIVLPKDWLETCFANLGDFSAVGGTAVPDGDCSTLHRLLSLDAKIVGGSISVTGNNALIKKSALLEMGDAWVTPLGEDFRLNQLLRMKGHQVSCIPKLVVQHNENKSYAASLKWLMASGIDATKLVFEFRRFRTPDLAFIFWLFALFYALIDLFRNKSFFGVSAFLFVTLLISASHFYSKFRILRAPFRSFIGTLLNIPLIVSYLLGRTFGLFSTFVKNNN